MQMGNLGAEVAYARLLISYFGAHLEKRCTQHTHIHLLLQVEALL